MPTIGLGRQIKPLAGIKRVRTSPARIITRILHHEHRHVACCHMRPALITGGTSGIGLAFAHALAREGRPLMLVARDAERLRARCDDLCDTYGVQVDMLRADLSDRADVDRVAACLRSGEFGMLINNAGFSLKTPLVDGDEALTDRAYEAMGRAPRVLSCAAASGMIERGEGTIITVVSMSALTRQDSYSALKAYTLATTEVLASELAGTGVTVTAVLPGWVRTEFHARSSITKRSKVPASLWLSPGQVAREALADAARGKVISVPSLRYKVIAGGLRVLPGGLMRSISSAISGRRPTRRTGGTA